MKLLTPLVVLAIFATLPAFPSEGRLGNADFANSCSAKVQPTVEQGILLLHSFEFQQAERNFGTVESLDPHCTIAAWGVALAETERAGADAPNQVLETGWAGLQLWLNQQAGTEREQMYMDAIKAMYQGYQDTSGAIRWNRYLERMDSLRSKYPDDLNASLFYALGLVWTAGPGQKGLAQRRKALSVLLPIFKEHPDNPGAAHYIIHAADTPELASIALPAARKYANIAPDSPHALHMPSHIFNRLGKWQDSINANLASVRVAEQWVKEGRGGQFDEQHALNNLEYAYLQLGNTDQARDVISKIDQFDSAPGGDPWGPIDARIYFDVENHDWIDALRLVPPANSSFDENFDVYWIHAIAEARLGKPTAAQASLEQFRNSSSEWIAKHGWGDVLHLALAQADAWTQYSLGKRAEAVRELSGAADFERRHPVYYADVLPRPSSEMLGEMLLEMGERKEACAAFRASLIVAPNTFNGVHGVHACAEDPLSSIEQRSP
jgi:tetratricopeptide (TPR) repeat protein